MDMADNRIQWIDVAKGIGILAVVLGHSSLGDSFPYRIIFSFHMPLFFFLSGLCFNKDRYTFAGLLKRRTRQLLVPLFLFSALLLLIRIPVLDYPAIFSFTGFPFALWFVFVLFWAEMAGYYMVDKPLVLSLLAGGISVLLYYCDIRLPYSLSCLPAAVMFYCMGYRFRSLSARKYPLYQLVCSKIGGGNTLLISVLSAAVVAYAYCNPVSMDMNQNRLPIESIPIALCGICLIVKMSETITGGILMRTLVFLGRNTLVIMAFHMFYLYVAAIHIKPLLSDGVLEMALYKIIQQVIMWTGVLATIWVVNHKAKWILGR